MALKDTHVLIPRNCEYINFKDKSNFADVIKLGILRWGGYPEVSG